MLSFKPSFLISFFIFIKKLFSSSLPSAIKVVSYEYLRLLVFLLAILILACASSSPAFHMMYSACKLNKRGDNTQPWCTPFPILNQPTIMSGSNCCFFTCIQVSQEIAKMAWYSHLFKNFPQFVMIQTVKGFHVVTEAEVDVFLVFPLQVKEEKSYTSFNKCIKSICWNPTTFSKKEKKMAETILRKLAIEGNFLSMLKRRTEISSYLMREKKVNDFFLKEEMRMSVFNQVYSLSYWRF